MGFFVTLALNIFHEELNFSVFKITHHFPSRKFIIILHDICQLTFKPICDSQLKMLTLKILFSDYIHINAFRTGNACLMAMFVQFHKVKEVLITVLSFTTRVSSPFHNVKELIYCPFAKNMNIVFVKVKM